MSLFFLKTAPLVGGVVVEALEWEVGFLVSSVMFLLGCLRLTLIRASNSGDVWSVAMRGEVVVRVVLSPTSGWFWPYELGSERLYLPTAWRPAVWDEKAGGLLRWYTWMVDRQ